MRFLEYPQPELNCFYQLLNVRTGAQNPEGSQASAPRALSREPGRKGCARRRWVEWVRGGRRLCGGVQKGPKGIVNLEEMSVPGPRPLEFPHGETLAPCPGAHFHLGWEWVGGAKSTQRPRPGADRQWLEHPLRALCCSPNSRGSLV